ncbi:MAG: methyltransferase domain-containing protein [Alphaproteobacteria bacterium]|nr:methyltransferase domain-containing protein [Alphaproteobacteria bacterium]MDE2164622.1 methyltransferase domain-containing protein [Alphaproteobacteria bacterium]MDE2265281.1 methyltransferase domain-containing protein [Alphaproteobacteria bacterium]
MDKTVHSLVSEQFSPRAAAYVTSAVHAKGEDLETLAAFARGRGLARALDLGCGGGHVSFALAPHVGAVVAYDLSEAMLAAVTQEAKTRGIANLSTRQGMVETLPFDDASFDFVATRYSAHHWHDVPRALKEARRVLKPGGRAMFMDVFAPETPLLDTFLQTVEMLRDPSHVRNYALREWAAMLRDAGFEPDTPSCHRIRLEFNSWIARMQTPPVQADAIRALQARAAKEVVAYFGVERDGSFSIDSMTITAAPA